MVILYETIYVFNKCGVSHWTAPHIFQIWDLRLSIIVHIKLNVVDVNLIYGKLVMALQWFHVNFGGLSLNIAVHKNDDLKCCFHRAYGSGIFVNLEINEVYYNFKNLEKFIGKITFYYTICQNYQSGIFTELHLIWLQFDNILKLLPVHLHFRLNEIPCMLDPLNVILNCV